MNKFLFFVKCNKCGKFVISSNYCRHCGNRLKKGKVVEISSNIKSGGGIS